MDRIRIEGLEVRCIVGVYRRERDVPQRLIVDVDLYLDTDVAARSGRLSDTVSYDHVAAQIAFLLEAARFAMLETAALTLARTLLAPPALGERRAQVERATIRLTKPEALKGHGTPSVEIARAREQVALEQEQKPFGVVDILHQTDDVGMYRLNLAPGRPIPLHVHRRMREAELVLTSGLRCQGKPVPPGTIFLWPLDTPHLWENPTDRWQTILCVDSPPFLPDDEIEVEGAPMEVAPHRLGWP